MKKLLLISLFFLFLSCEKKDIPKLEGYSKGISDSIIVPKGDQNIPVPPANPKPRPKP